MHAQVRRGSVAGYATDETLVCVPKEHGSVKKKIGNPDLMILFTNTVSHKMVITASQEAKKNNIPIARIHTSSATALRSVLDEHCAAAM